MVWYFFNPHLSERNCMWTVWPSSETRWETILFNRLMIMLIKPRIMVSPGESKLAALQVCWWLNNSWYFWSPVNLSESKVIALTICRFCNCPSSAGIVSKSLSAIYKARSVSAIHKLIITTISGPWGHNTVEKQFLLVEVEVSACLVW